MTITERIRWRALSVSILSSLDKRVALLALMTAIVLVGAVLRLVSLQAIGFNSDEAVYTGQGAAIAGVEPLSSLFPVFRAHPLLFQGLVSILLTLGGDVGIARLVSATFGLLAIPLVFVTARRLFSTRVAVVAAAVISLMPYHVIVSRQALLDAPLVFFTTLALYALTRFGQEQTTRWLMATGAALGLAVLTKEVAILFVGALYMFLALSPTVVARLRDVALLGGVLVLTILPWPAAAALAGGGARTGEYLVWQLLRQPNHGLEFYLVTVPTAVGVLVVVFALIGLARIRHRTAWQERLLFSWCVVPIVFFELWPTKGFQYLLPIAPALAILAARGGDHFATWVKSGLDRRAPVTARFPLLVHTMVSVALIGTVLFSSTLAVSARPSDSFLAGSGGVFGGREAGQWIANNTPAGSQIMTIGPSMANIIQFYGGRAAFGLSVSSNPIHRNPSYQPIRNADLAILSHDFQYLVWDAYSAARSETFSQSLLEYVRRYNGRAVHTESVELRDASGAVVSRPVIVIYRVQA